MRACLLLAGLLLLPACGPSGHPAGRPEAAGTAPEAARVVAERGPVRLIVEAAPKRVGLSGEVRLTISIEHEPGVTVQKPVAAEASGDFRVLERSEALPGVERGRTVLRQEALLEPLRSGAQKIGPVTLTFVDGRAGGDGRTHTLACDPIEIEVATAIATPATSLDGLRAPAAPVPLPAPATPIGWAVAVLAAATASVLILRRFRRAGGTPSAATSPLPSPQELAARELETLLARGWIDSDVKLFYVELTAIVRRYVERTRGIHAPEQTTEEFLREADRRRLFPEEEGLRLRAFLESADLVKFAALQPARADVEESLHRARSFLGLDGEGGAT